METERYNCSLRSALISFEGIDGSGKTTQLQRLKDILTQQGRPVTVAREPGGTRVGSEIRRLLLDAANTDLRPIPELLLYFASRAQNIEEVILPALQAGRIVLADRFTDATVAYQGYGRELGVETVRAIERVACAGVKPGLTLLIDIDPATGLSRALQRNCGLPRDESRMERQSLEFFERVQRGYLELSRQEPERIKIVDGRRSVGEVGADIEAIVKQFLNQRETNEASASP